MRINEFKDRLFDILNDTESLPIADIIIDDRKNEIKILLDDHSSFCYQMFKKRGLVSGTLMLKSCYWLTGGSIWI